MEKLDDKDVTALYELATERDEAIAAANVAVLAAKSAEARFAQKQIEVAKRYKLRGKDAYDEEGVIHRGGQPEAVKP